MAGIQKWGWVVAVLGAFVVLASCVVTSAPDERREVESAFRALPEVRALFGEVYTMSSLMRPARVRWIGGVKSGYFNYDVRGRSFRGEVIISGEKIATSGPVTITEVTFAGGKLTYSRKSESTPAVIE